MSPLPRITVISAAAAYGPALTAYRGGGWVQASSVPPSPPPPPPGPGSGLLLEDGSGLVLLETGDYLLQE
jgi:hypothetical protein